MAGHLDLDTYQLTGDGTNVEWVYEGKPIFCSCRLLAPRWTSWTDANPGRRFYGCQNWQVRAKYCKFRLWHDPDYNERTRDIINDLKWREKRLYDEAIFWKQQAENLQNNAVEAVDLVEAELIVENARLKHEIAIMNKKKNETVVSHGISWKILLLVCLVIVLWSFIFNGFKRQESSKFALP